MSEHTSEGLPPIKMPRSYLDYQAEIDGLRKRLNDTERLERRRLLVTLAAGMLSGSSCHSEITDQEVTGVVELAAYTLAAIERLEGEK